MPVLKDVSRAEKFDPENKDHRTVYANFLETGKLSKRFDIEFPYVNMVVMMQGKLAEYACRKEMKIVSLQEAKRKAS